MRAKIHFSIKMISPELEFDKDDAITALRLWCHGELHMPLNMVKAVCIEKLVKKQEVKDE